jgi:SNF2 family DNA or RNA helicase
MNIIRGEEKSHGFVIFCHFNDEIEVLKNILEEDGTIGNVFVYDGSLTPAQRTKVLEDTEKSVKKSHDHLDCQHTILLAQIQTAGTGLNLQFMDRVIFTSPWWTAALMDQAVGRVVRLGQKEQVHIHHISLKEEEEMSINIDDYINERVETKRELCTQMLAAAKHTV